MAGTTWATYIAGGSLPPTVQALCEAVDTHDRSLPTPLGGVVTSALTDAVNTLAQELQASGKAG